MKDLDRQYAELLDPEVLRPRLTKAALFIVAFEMLKDTIVERPSRFFEPRPGSGENPTLKAILCRNPSPVYAVLDWLGECGAIDVSDIELFERVKGCRNHLAHRMLLVLAETGLPPDFDETYEGLLRLLRKIEVWWILQVDIPTDPGFDGQEIDPESIMPGPVAGLLLLNQVAMGSQKKAGSTSKLSRHDSIDPMPNNAMKPTPRGRGVMSARRGLS